MQVLLVLILLHSNSKSTETVLDDRTQRTMILLATVQQLQLNGECETFPLCTVQRDLTHFRGPKVSYEISLPNVTHRNNTKCR